MVTCLYHDVGGGRDMRDVIREYEWYYKGTCCIVCVCVSLVALPSYFAYILYCVCGLFNENVPMFAH